MQKIAKTLLLVLGVIVVIQAVQTALMTLALRNRNPRALHLVKGYNKYILNPVILRFSGRSGFSAIVHHVGRRSGKPYATPVIAHHFDRDVVIPLPYGTDIDWLRNLLDTGEGVVDVDGRNLNVDEPAVVDMDEVVELLPASIVRITQMNGTRQAVRLRVSTIPTPVPT